MAKSTMSNALQTFYAKNPNATDFDTAKKFPQSKFHQRTYARGRARDQVEAEADAAAEAAAAEAEADAVASADPGQCVGPTPPPSPRRKTPVQITAKVAADLGKVRGGMPEGYPFTAVMLNVLLFTRQSAGVSTSGKSAMFSVEDLEAVARNMAMEASAKQRKAELQQQ